MKKQILLLSIATVMALFSVTTVSANSPQWNNYPDANSELLPENYSVWTNGNTPVNNPRGGGAHKVLPTNNGFKDAPGCYIACYSHGKDGVYSVGGNIQVFGQVRVPGEYQQRVCIPTDFENVDISAVQKFKDLCNQTFDSCKNAEGGCWAGGDTGGWFGIQENGSQW